MGPGGAAPRQGPSSDSTEGQILAVFSFVPLWITLPEPQHQREQSGRDTLMPTPSVCPEEGTLCIPEHTPACGAQLVRARRGDLPESGFELPRWGPAPRIPAGGVPGMSLLQGFDMSRH